MSEDMMQLNIVGSCVEKEMLHALHCTIELGRGTIYMVLIDLNIMIDENVRHPSKIHDCIACDVIQSC